jgi:hypothetical protein
MPVDLAMCHLSREKSNMVSFELDSFITQKDKTFWIAKLSDGRTVYQDDDRPDYEERNAWLRLKKFCEENNLFVTQVKIQFRDHIEVLPESNEGYFFRYGAFGCLKSKKSYSRFIVGPVKNNQVEVQVWRIPEIILENEYSETRNIEDCKDGLIKNKTTDNNGAGSREKNKKKTRVRTKRMVEPS